MHWVHKDTNTHEITAYSAMSKFRRRATSRSFTTIRSEDVSFKEFRPSHKDVFSEVIGLGGNGIAKEAARNTGTLTDERNGVSMGTSKDGIF